MQAQHAFKVDYQADDPQAVSERYARCIAASKRIRWDIDDDVIRGRQFDFDQKFLPDGLSLVDRLDFLSPGEQRYLSQIQGRTYANIFGLAERVINAKVLEISRDHCFGDQVALEALIRFSDEELKHQALFRRIEEMIAPAMANGYRLLPDPNEIAVVVLGKSTWGVLGLTCHIELFTQAHYKESIQGDEELSELYKDVFLFHWKEESQHAIIDELEWRREHVRLSAAERDRGVDDFIALVSAFDGVLQAQSAADAEYFSASCGRILPASERKAVHDLVLRAYRWQYILSGAQEPRFIRILGELTTPVQMDRITAALESLAS